MRRASRLASQLTPANVSHTPSHIDLHAVRHDTPEPCDLAHHTYVPGPDSAMFSIVQMQAFATTHISYGTLTPDILPELLACVADPTTQIFIDPSSAIGQQHTTAAAPQDVKQTVLELEKHSQDHSHYSALRPLCVVYPQCANEVALVAKLCHRHHIPCNPMGTRTGLEGGSLAVIPGVTVDMSRMNRIIKVYPEEMLVEVEPGVKKSQLQQHLAKLGFYFPVDPGSDACLGGYANTNASGILFGGTMTKCTRQLEIVTAQGEIMITRTRAQKTSAGYNLHNLIIGSEGTLCLITRLLVEIKKIPKTQLTCQVVFPSTKDATMFVNDLIQEGMSELMRIELLNQTGMQSINAYSQTNYVELPTLFIELGAKNNVMLNSCQDILQETGKRYNMVDYYSTSDPTESNTVWNARKMAFFAAMTQYQRLCHDSACPTCGTTPLGNKPENTRMALLGTDMCVPIHLLSDIAAWTEDQFASRGMPCVLVGHVGDGNFHCAMPFNANCPYESKCVKSIHRAMLLKSISVGGTITGEHGIGMGKMAYLPLERGPTAMRWMMAIKQSLDPHYIFNCFKVFTPQMCECLPEDDGDVKNNDDK